MPEYKTTKRDFEYFKKVFLYFRDLFGLQRYEICFQHGNMEDSLASYWLDIGACQVVITLSVIWVNKKPTRENLAYAAFHEARHLLMGRLDTNAHSRFVTKDELTESIHEIIGVDENVVFPLLWDKFKKGKA